MAEDSAPHGTAPIQPESVSDATLRGLIGYSMKRAFMVIRADLARTLEPFELRMMTFTALTLVADNPGLSQSQLAQAMAVERPNLVVIVDELETRGLITRDRVPTDRRTYALHITSEGAQLLARATRAVHQHENGIMGKLTAEEEAALIATLKRIEASGGRS
ncbi:MarR family winged helix-turn-helix transcriptional regulator [Sinisalibacter aestuarii]|uniref:Transcriptional regulator n=1 Tax=Sinisalibacter aestuarii TaxID=2949426 RepID=A0ABQ5LST3_9RHOB|nr:MarR family transcriptional regulator [Sinisalibacter aestuarii]GKY88050.1 transcriptional regulator [Sinisalibacter aestuarii]